MRSLSELLHFRLAGRRADCRASQLIHVGRRVGV